MTPRASAPVPRPLLATAILFAAFASAVPRVASGAVPPPAQPQSWTGTATGEMTVQKAKVPLRHAYAVVVRPRKSTADETRIVLSEEPIPLEVLEDLLKSLPSFGFRGVEVLLDAAGAPTAVFFHHEGLPAGLEVREVTKLAAAPAEAGRLAGRLTFLDPGFSFGFDATFEAPVYRPPPKPSRVADPGLSPEQQARAALNDQGLEFTPGAFDKVVGDGDVEAVKLFLAAGMPATTGEPRRSVLAEAVEKGHAPVVRLLLAAGADPNGGDYNGTPLLYVASEQQGVDVVRALVEGGAEVGRKGDGNITALHAAAGAGRHETVSHLLGAGAKVTARTTSGWTALHSAVQRGDLPMVKKLIAAGADVARDRKELLGYARSGKHKEIEKAILDAGKAAPKPAQKKK